MTMQFFKNISDVKALKKEYIRLLKLYHPDQFHTETEIAQAVERTKLINTEYARLYEILKDNSRNVSEEQQKQEYHYWRFEEQFREIIHILTNCDWIEEIELTGCFIWMKVSYENRKKLKELNLDYSIRYASKKKLWYIVLDKDYRSHNRKEYDMNHIREIYGSDFRYSKDRDTSEKEVKYALEA